MDTDRRRIGFRTVALDTEPDETGTPFTFVVNGTPVFAKGANWIPDDHLLTRVTRERLARRDRPGRRREHEHAAGLGRRHLRDRRLLRRLRRAGRAGLAGLPLRLRLLRRGGAAAQRGRGRGAGERHPAGRRTRRSCCGTATTRTCAGYADWGLAGAPSTGAAGGSATTPNCCPALVAELDPTRPYAPGSPYSPGDLPAQRRATTAPATSGTSGTALDYTHYRDHIPRFCAEFGFQGPPTWATLTRWIHDEPLTPDLARVPAPPEGRGRQRQARPRPGSRTCRCPDDFERLALGDTAQPGAGRRVRRRALPLLVAAHRRGTRLAAQRLLAGHLVGRRGRRRTAQAPLVRAQARVRAAAADRAAAQTADPHWSRSTTRPAVDGCDPRWRGRPSPATSWRPPSCRSLSRPGRSPLVDLPTTCSRPSTREREVLVAAVGGVRVHHLFAEDRDLAYDPAPSPPRSRPWPAATGSTCGPPRTSATSHCWPTRSTATRSWTTCWSRCSPARPRLHRAHRGVPGRAVRSGASARAALCQHGSPSR